MDLVGRSYTAESLKLYNEHFCCRLQAKAMMSVCHVSISTGLAAEIRNFWRIN